MRNAARYEDVKAGTQAGREVLALSFGAGYWILAAKVPQITETSYLGTARCFGGGIFEKWAEFKLTWMCDAQGFPAILQGLSLSKVHLPGGRSCRFLHPQGTLVPDEPCLVFPIGKSFALACHHLGQKVMIPTCSRFCPPPSSRRQLSGLLLEQAVLPPRRRRAKLSHRIHEPRRRKGIKSSKGGASRVCAEDGRKISLYCGNGGRARARSLRRVIRSWG